jgi:hypothetical protein
MRIEMRWSDRQRRFGMRLAPGSRMRGPRRLIEIRIAGSDTTHEVVFGGSPIDITL